MIALLELVPRWVLLMVAGFFMAAWGYSGVQLAGTRTELAEAKTESAELKVAIAQSSARAATLSKELTTAVLKAEHEAQKRKEDLRLSAAAAATESDGLRNDVAGLRDQLAGFTAAAAAERAIAIGEVFGQCTRRYTELAARCDRHVDDVRTLMEAWPRSPGLQH